MNVTAALQLRSAAIAALPEEGLNPTTGAPAPQLAVHGVRVNAVTPGIVGSLLRSPQSNEFLIAMQPARRTSSSTIGGIAGAGLCLVGADFNSGVVLPVDGGGSVRSS